jgi:Tol biopolymer transport system component
MGEVYKARDTRLERTVAIKVLPPALAADPEFRARFEREAKSISALNHPHICTLYDVGEANGTSYLVMEHLEGETLADRLLKGPLPVNDALALASQIADALDKAHRQGIVHRDLKPANVFLVRSLGASGTPHGKLLDFGLAKIGVAVASGSYETRLATSPPVGTSAPLTAQGTILGTFQYMAPEQIEGQEADARADIWAFGCLLYEMLTGRRAFEGKSQASLIASILERQPTPTAELQPLTPPAVGRVVRTCLEKDPDNRFHTAHDLRLQLQWIEEGGSAAGVPAPVVAGRRRRARGFAAAGLLAAAVAGAGAVWWLKPAPVVPAIVGRFTLLLPDGQDFTRTGRRVVAISPDGTKVAYVANRQIYLRKLEDFQAVPIPGTDLHPGDVTFSPDGMSLAFAAARQGEESLANASIMRISVAGGAPVPLTPADSPTGLRWQNDRILYVTGAAIKSVPANGGPPQTLVEVESGAGRVARPQLLPDGRTLLYSYRPSTPGEWQIAIQPIAGGERQILVAEGADGRVTSTGHLVWLHDNVLFAQAFEARQLSGVPVPLVQGVRFACNTATGQFALSENGSLVFVPGAAADTNGQLVWVDRTGREEPIGAPPDRYRTPRISPDGTRIAVLTGVDQGDIGIWDITRKTMSRLTSGPESENTIAWSPDSKWIFFASSPTGGTPDVYRRAADGTGTLTRLTQTTSPHFVQMVVPRSDRLLVRVSAEKNVLGLLPMAGGELEPLFSGDVAAQTGRISPDGRWIAYQSSEGSTRDEVHVRPFPDTDAGHWQISSGGGTQVLWSRSGRELFYRAGAPRRLMRVDVLAPSAAGAFNHGRPSVMLDATKYTTLGSTSPMWDISPDDRRFVMVVQAQNAADFDTAPSMKIVTNWFEELRSRVKDK